MSCDRNYVIETTGSTNPEYFSFIKQQEIEEPGNLNGIRADFPASFHII